jgi:hypothetical protein
MIGSLRLERTTTRLELRDWTTRVKAFALSTQCRLMGGHWRVLHTTRDRIALRCVACGHTSPGWSVGRKAD